MFFLADISQPLPDWIWPPAIIIIGLAVGLGVLVQRGVVYFGREVDARLEEKDTRITELKAELTQERVQRAADAQAMNTALVASQMARSAMAEAAERMGDDRSGPYEQRVAAGRRHRRESDGDSG